MTAVLRVLAPGLLTTVQDLGRPGYQSRGIPVSGALDPISFRAANVLVGNPPNTGALEVAYTGPTLAVESGEARLSFVGANRADRNPVRRDGNERPANRRHAQHSLAPRRSGAHRLAHRAAPCSISPSRAASPSRRCSAAYRPICAAPSADGKDARWPSATACRCAATSQASAKIAKSSVSISRRPTDIARSSGRRAIISPPQRLETFFNSEYVVSAGADRMGMRLKGPRLEHARGINIISDGIAPGSVQVPGNELPIVLLADRQTVGGYPKIATVISADLPAVGRLPIGAKIRFWPSLHRGGGSGPPQVSSPRSRRCPARSCRSAEPPANSRRSSSTAI